MKDRFYRKPILRVLDEMRSEIAYNSDILCAAEQIRDSILNPIFTEVRKKYPLSMCLDIFIETDSYHTNQFGLRTVPVVKVKETVNEHFYPFTWMRLDEKAIKDIWEKTMKILPKPGFQGGVECNKISGIPICLRMVYID